MREDIFRNQEIPSAFDVVKLLIRLKHDDEARRVLMLVDQIKYQQGRLEAFIDEQRVDSP